MIGTLVLEQPSQLTWGHVSQHPAEMSFLGHHARDVQVFDGDNVEPTGQGVRQVVQAQGSSLGDLAVQAGAAVCQPPMVLRALLTPGNLSVKSSKPVQLVFEYLWVGDMAGLIGQLGDQPGQRCEVFYTDVNADHTAVLLAELDRGSRVKLVPDE
jgi:hypothetical protein